MTRKECIDYIKSNNYGMEATKVAREYTGNAGVNYTNLPTEVLQAFVEGKKKPIKPVTKKVHVEYRATAKCADEGARKAILAIAKILNLKNIERNFD